MVGNLNLLNLDVKPTVADSFWWASLQLHNFRDKMAVKPTVANSFWWASLQ